MNPAVKRGAQLVVSDRKQMVCAGNAYSHYEAEIVNTGAGLTECQFLADNVKITYNSEQTTLNCVSRGERYRFGFNGQEKDDEMYGEGNACTVEFCEYDPRSGSRWNVDPMTAKYPDQSPYACFNNNPIYYSDILGLEGTDPPKSTKEEANSYIDGLKLENRDMWKNVKAADFLSNLKNSINNPFALNQVNGTYFAVWQLEPVI